MIRVLVVDDHAILRDGIKSILESQDDIVVIGEAADGAVAIQRVGELLPDVVLMDLSMPEVGGLEATRYIQEHHPGVKVLVLTQHGNPEYVKPVLQAGAAGYVLKRAGRREMLNALRQVHEQGVYLGRDVTRTVMRDLAGEGSSSRAAGSRLTERERDVLRLTAQGKSNKEIATALGISPKTVSVHRTNVMAKLGVQNTIELVRLAEREHLTGPELAE